MIGQVIAYSHANSKSVRRISIFLLGGLTVGLSALAMAWLADQAQTLFLSWVRLYPWLPLLMTPIGFALLAGFTQVFIPNASGSGIPQVIAACRTHSRSLRLQLVSIPIALAKVLLMALGFLCGASIGREGPSVQVGAAIMAQLSPWVRRRSHDLLVAGASAGVAAAFSTPLAGVVFAIEEINKSFATRTSGLLIGAIVTAGLTTLTIMGDYTYFGTSHLLLSASDAVLPCVLTGLVGGLAGGLFCKILSGMPWMLTRFSVTRSLSGKLLFAAGCGLGVALIGVYSAQNIFGTGYSVAKDLIVNGGPLDGMFGVWKFLATTLSSISGIPGGIFSPSLAIGAGLGADVSYLLPNVPTQILAILGMAAFLSGAVQAPLTAFVIVMEMTNDHALALPLMASSLIAWRVVRLISAEGVYHLLAHRYLPKP